MIHLSKCNNISKREKKISKLLKYENNIQSLMNVEKIEEESKLNKESSKDSSQILKNNSPLIIIEKKEEEHINKKSTLKDPNEIKGVEHDMPLTLDTIMFSPLKDIEKKKIKNELFNENNLEDFSIEKDNNFNNLHSIVKRINFNKIIVNCGNLFSQNNQKYVNFFYSFNKQFTEENNMKKKNLINTNNDKNLSFSTQQGSNKKDFVNNE